MDGQSGPALKEFGPARPARALILVCPYMESEMGQKVTITETEEVPLGDGVKLVRDVTERPEPEHVDTVKKTVTVEEKVVSRD